MFLAADLDPVEIRIVLEQHRRNGTPWPVAWKDAAGKRPVQDRSSWLFMEKHFRAAYFNTPSSLGRCSVPERDTSSAIGLSAVPSERPVGSCRWGDRCDQPAGHGNTGLFCESHAGSLEAIAVELRGGKPYEGIRRQAA